MPSKSVVYEGPADKGQATAYVVEAKLKVMLEEDYVALNKNSPPPSLPRQGGGMQVNSPPLVGGVRGGGINTLGSKIVREIIIPILEQEVNEGANFVQLRQIYHSLILATWYKKKIKDGIIAKQYVDQKKVDGLVIARSDPKGPFHGATKQSKSMIASPSARNDDVDHIYQQYLQAFKKGVYNFIKEEPDPAGGQSIPRKYFSGGAVMRTALQTTSNRAMLIQPDHAQVVHVNFNDDSAMSIGDKAKTLDIEALIEQGHAVYHSSQGKMLFILRKGQKGSRWINVIDINGSEYKAVGHTHFSFNVHRASAFFSVPILKLDEELTAESENHLANTTSRYPFNIDLLSKTKGSFALWVEKDYRSLGLGIAMLSGALEIAKREGARTAFIKSTRHSISGELPSINFYRNKFKTRNLTEEEKDRIEGDLAIDLLPNPAMSTTGQVKGSSTGGIDLNRVDQSMSVAGKGEFKFTAVGMDHVRINSLTPVITSIEELKSLPEFLGIN